MDEPHPLRVYLDRRGETQEAFAQRAGISQSYVNEIIKRKRRPSLATIEKIIVATRGKLKPAHFF